MTTASVHCNRDGDRPKRRDRADLVDCLADFERVCPDEENAKERAFSGLSDEGVNCDCGNEVMFDSDSERCVDCQNCNSKVWITAKTMFANVRKFRPRLLLIFLMEHGVLFNPHELSVFTGFAYSTLRDALVRLDMFLEREMPDDAPRVPSALFSLLFLRRTTETPARSHPREEQTQIDQAAFDAEDPGVIPKVVQGETDGFTGELSEGEQKIWNCLTEEPTHFDTLYSRSGMPIGEFNATMLFLELRGLVNGSQDYFARVPGAQSIIANVDFSNAPVNEFKALVKTVSGGVGRRLIQLHLAAYWCFADRERWGPGKLLSACLRSPPISQEEVRRYVSPRMVKILPRFAVNSS